MLVRSSRRLKYRSALQLLCCGWLLFSANLAAAADRLLALGYHDVRDNLAINYDPDQYAVTSEHLAAHFRWLQAHNYRPVSVDQVIRAVESGGRLPYKAVLLTFDDGFRSVYTHVYPLLKTFGYPAVVSPVTSWIESDTPIDYNGQQLTADAFLTWQQMREMQASGLVEIASHSDNLHRGIIGNPQGNRQPAAVTLQYLTTNSPLPAGMYESPTQNRSRIDEDLRRSVALIEQNLGVRPRLITWPYGAWNELTRELATGLGLRLSLTLDAVGPIHQDGRIGREMLVANPGIGRFASTLEEFSRPQPVRAVQVDLDYVYDADPARQEANLGLLLDRIKAMRISHVFLQAFADPDGDGAADALYYPNRHLPMRADLFNRAAWQLRTRANVAVFAWLPISAFSGPDLPASWQVLQSRNGTVSADPEGEPRLSVFVPAARRMIEELYDDLGRHATFQGIHFHDDGRLNEFEDVNPMALEAFSRELGEPFELIDTDNDPQLAQAWATFKATALTDFTTVLADTVRRWQPALKTSRNLFATALLNPDAEMMLGQSYQQFLNNYTYTTIMAMPDFENSSDKEQFYQRLIRGVRAHPGAMQKTIFQLQTVDWRVSKPIPAKQLRRTMEYLRTRGVDNLAYYPDDFITGTPDLTEMIRGMSLAETPWGGEQ